MTDFESNLAAAQRAYDRQLPQDPPDEDVSLRDFIEARLDELDRPQRLALAGCLIDLYGLLCGQDFEDWLADLQRGV